MNIAYDPKLRVQQAILSALLLCIGLPIIAQATNDLPEPLQSALALHDSQRSTHWAFIRETRDADGHYVESYDPDRPAGQRWTLLQLNGKQPSKKALKRYSRDYAELAERQSPTDFDLSDLIDTRTARLVRTTEKSLDYEFTPLADDEDDEQIVAHLRGTVSVDRVSGMIKSIRIENTGEFSPVAMVRISTLLMEIRFEDNALERPRFLASAQTETSGKFMGFKKFTESEHVIYRDFKSRQASTETSVFIDKTRNGSF